MRLIHSAAGLCMMLLACSVHTETMAASQKVNVRAADAQNRAGVGQRGRAIDSNYVDAASGTQAAEFEDGEDDDWNDITIKDSDKIGPDGTIFLHDSEKQGSSDINDDCEWMIKGCI